MILITGCTTQLGKKLVDALAAKGAQIRCMDLEKPKNLPAGAEFIQCDVFDAIMLKKACQGVDTVFHLLQAAGNSRRGLMYMRRINIRFTRDLLAGAKAAGVGRFFFLSSYEVYGKSRKLPTRPEDRTRPVTRFGRHKLKAEKLLAPYKKEMQITVFRPALVVGPGTDNPIILITLLMAMAMDDANRLYITGHGDNRFQFVHPDDVISAIMKAKDAPAATGKIFNIGSDSVPTQLEQTVMVKEKGMLDCSIRHLSPFTTKLMSFLLRPFKINYLNKEHLAFLLTDLILDCDMAKTELGWTPTRGNIDMFLETIQWYRDEKL